MHKVRSAKWLRLRTNDGLMGKYYLNCSNMSSFFKMCMDNNLICLVIESLL